MNWNILPYLSDREMLYKEVDYIKAQIGQLIVNRQFSEFNGFEMTIKLRNCRFFCFLKNKNVI